MDATVLTVATDSNWWDPYVDDNGVATLDGTLDAIDDYETDNPVEAVWGG